MKYIVIIFWMDNGKQCACEKSLDNKFFDSLEEAKNYIEQHQDILKDGERFFIFDEYWEEVKI